MCSNRKRNILSMYQKACYLKICYPIIVHKLTEGKTEMSRITKIQQEILALSEADYVQLRQWFSGLDWEKWEQEIEADSEAGKLDFLITEAREEKGVLKDL